MVGYGKSASARRAMYGPASQMKHESRERRERTALTSQLAKQHAATKAAAAVKTARRKAGETGMSAGTMGGSRSLAGAWFDSAKSERKRGRPR